MVALIAYWTADAAVRVLPEAAANRVARALARWTYALNLPARRRLETNLAHLLSSPGGGAATAPASGSGPAAERTDVCARARALARRAHEHFALSLVDFLRLRRIAHPVLRARIEVRGAEHLERARASGRGVILLSAHLGNWEWGAAYLASLGERVHIAARPHRDPRVEAFFARRRRRWGVSPLRGHPLWLAASSALRRHEWVALMGDRLPDAAGLDRAPAGSLCAWAASLARRTGALVLPAVMLRLSDGRYAACFEPPLSPEACLDGGYRDAMRRYLMAEPDQWCAFDPLPAGLA